MFNKLHRVIESDIVKYNSYNNKNKSFPKQAKSARVYVTCKKAQTRQNEDRKRLVIKAKLFYLVDDV